MKGAKMVQPKHVTDALSGKIAAHDSAEQQEYLCGCCQERAFHDPVSVTCPEGHLFHRRCLEPKLKSESRCPTCKYTWPMWSSMVGGEKFKPIKGPLLAKIKAWKVECPQKCGTTLPFAQLSTHVEDECSRTMFVCGSRGCDTECCREDMRAHIPGCLYALVSCEQCGDGVRKCDLQTHMPNDCSHRKVGCDRCGGQTVYCRQEDHKTRCSGGAQVRDVAALKNTVLERDREIAFLRMQIDQLVALVNQRRADSAREVQHIHERLLRVEERLRHTRQG